MFSFKMSVFKKSMRAYKVYRIGFFFTENSPVLEESTYIGLVLAILNLKHLKTIYFFIISVKGAYA